MFAAFAGVTIAVAARAGWWWPFAAIFAVTGFGYLLGLSNYGVGEEGAADDGNDLLAVLDGKAAARQETILHIDDEQRGCLVGFDRRCPERAGDEGCGGYRGETCQNQPASEHGAPPDHEPDGGKANSIGARAKARSFGGLCESAGQPRG